MNAFRTGHSRPTGSGCRSWVSYPLWFAGLGWGGRCLAVLFLWPLWLSIWLVAEEIVLIACLFIVVVRVIRHDRFHIVAMRLPYGLIAFDTV